jgi:hypothetical protein
MGLAEAYSAGTSRTTPKTSESESPLEMASRVLGIEDVDVVEVEAPEHLEDL